jgi:hypothetical protein
LVGCFDDCQHSRIDTRFGIAEGRPECNPNLIFLPVSCRLWTWWEEIIKVVGCKLAAGRLASSWKSRSGKDASLEVIPLSPQMFSASEV